MKILSKALVFSFFLLSTFCFLSSATPSYAIVQSPQPTQLPTQNTNADVPNNLHNWTQNVMIEVMSALSCQLAGVDPTNPKQGCLGIDSASGKIGFLPPPAGGSNGGGAIGFMGNMIATLYTPPLHTSDYFKDLASNFGINKKAYAQSTGGTGFQGLTPLIGIWTAFRNIVYLVFVIVFIVIGLAIMLRIKIDPRTVMTIQNQIPKIIIGIPLVTFSFAIGGFLVDLMWVMIYLVFGLISGISPDIAKSVAELNPTELQGKSPLGAAIGYGQLSSMVHNVAASTTGIIQKMLGIDPSLTDLPLGFGLVKNFSGFLGGLLPGKFVWGAETPVNFLIDLVSGIGSVFGGIQILKFPVIEGSIGALGFEVGGSPGWFANLPFAIPFAMLLHPLLQELLRVALPYLIVYIIIFIALLIALFRLWFTLLMAYINILIDVVLAPFWIIGTLVPGSPVSATAWLRDLIANLAAFPTVIAMFLLGKAFVDAFKTASEAGQNIFVPPLIGNINDPNMFSSLIGIGIILMTPNVVNILKTALKAPKIDTGGVGQGLGAGAKVFGGTIKSTAGAGVAYIAGDPLTRERGAGGIGRMLQRRFFGS